MQRFVSLVSMVSVVAMGLAGCEGCTDPVGGADDAGVISEGEGEGEGEPVDAGNGFDLGGLLDGGVLDCLPGALPELSAGGALDLLALSPYSGRSEPGVRCGDVTCDRDVPCCSVCGFGACAAANDQGVIECPPFTAQYDCDGDEECPGADVCCFSVQGTRCRSEAECAIDIGDTIGQFIVDGGIALPQPVDGGFVDGGFVPVVAVEGGFADGGFADGGFADGGFVDNDPSGAPIPGEPVIGPAIAGAPVDGGFAGGEPIDGGAGPVPDAGSIGDAVADLLNQGAPVCRSTFFDCDIFALEACCTSERLSAVDLGFCMPALVCLGNVLP